MCRMNHPREFQSMCTAATSVIYHKVSLRQTKINCEFLELQLITGISVVLRDYRHCVSSHEIYEGDSISKLQIVSEKNRMEIMTCKQHLFFNIISIQI